MSIKRDPLSFDPRILDAYAALSYKGVFDSRRGGGERGAAGIGWIQQSWIPREAQRRLYVYSLLSTYLTGNARRAITDLDPEAQLDHREYGDVRLIVSRIVSGILGDRLDFRSLALDKAEASPPSLDGKPIEPEGEDGDSVEMFLYREALDVWTTRKRAEITEWKTRADEAAGLREGFDTIQQWIRDESFEAKIVEMESEHTVPLGDGAVEFAWSTLKKRPVMIVHPPDAYHPDLDTDDGEFPTRVHLVWEIPHDNEGEGQKVRRITYELLPVDFDPDAVVDGEVAPRSVRCHLTDVIFDTAQAGHNGGEKVYGESVLEWPANMPGAEIQTNEDGVPALAYDLGIDFIPIVHVPNTSAFSEHFGLSSIATLCRLLDDIAACDTDLQRAAALAGSPLVMLTGVNPDEDFDIAPGEVWSGGEKGGMTALDITHNVETLSETIRDLYRRLAAVAQVPEAMLGLVETTNFPSGIALRMAYAPFDQLVATARLVRRRKYALMLKMVTKLYTENGQPIPDLDIEPEFGVYVPFDESEAADVAASLHGKGMSTETVVEYLRLRGFPMSDDEVRKIRAEDFEGARTLADATESAAAAIDYLGIEVEPPAALAAPATSVPADAAFPQIDLDADPEPVA